MEKLMINNEVTVAGEITEELEFDHECKGEKFYKTAVSVKRLSGVDDEILVIVSERILNFGKEYKGKDVMITGQFRSYNKYGIDGKRHVILYVFAREMELVEANLNINHISLNGYICKETLYRMTSTEREVTDVLLAVNRPYGKTDYIPCICWGRNARFVDTLEIGANLKVEGRIQKREYVKKFSETESEIKTAYEVSISTMEVIDSGKED